MIFEDYKKGKIIKLKSTIEGLKIYINSLEAQNHRNIKSQQTKFLKLCEEALIRFETNNLNSNDVLFFDNYKNVNFNIETIKKDFSSL